MPDSRDAAALNSWRLFDLHQIAIDRGKIWASYRVIVVHLQVFKQLSPSDLARCACACRRWKQLTSSHAIWHDICVQQGVLADVSGTAHHLTSSHEPAASSLLQQTPCALL